MHITPPPPPNALSTLEVNNTLLINQRSAVLDYMKGILIVMTVLGHISTPLTSWIYEFHMPVFFMISGFCWKTKHSCDLASIKYYVVGKLKRLYVPFVIVNVLFILLNNVFLRIGFTTCTDNMIDWYTGRLASAEFMSAQTMIKGIVKALFFSGGYAKLCGVTWFLSSLFMVSIGHMLLEFFFLLLFKTSKNIKTIRRILLLIILFFCLSSCFIIKHFDIGLPGAINRFFGCYAAYLLGVLFKEYGLIKIINPITCIVAFLLTVAFLFLPIDTAIDLSKGVIGNPVSYVILCFSGFIFCYEIARLFAGINLRPIEICGKESMAIMLFHCISFKIVTFLYLSVIGLPMVLLAAYPALNFENLLLYILYLITGVLVPVACKRSFIRLKASVRCKNNQ